MILKCFIFLILILLWFWTKIYIVLGPRKGESFLFFLKLNLSKDCLFKLFWMWWFKPNICSILFKVCTLYIYICLLLLSLKMYSLYNYRHFYSLQIVIFRFWKRSSITLCSFHSNNLEEKIIEFIHKVFFNYLSIRNWWALIVLEATFLCQCQGQEFIAVTTRRLVEGHRRTTFFCHGLHFFLSRFLNLTLVFSVLFPTSSLIWNVLLVFTLTLQIYF